MNGDLSSGKHRSSNEHVSLSDAEFGEEMASQRLAWISPLIACYVAGCPARGFITAR